MTVGRSDSDSPSARWSREHGNKVVHMDLWSAWRHALSLSRRRWRDVARTGKPWLPYRCRWSDWYREGQTGLTAVAHWHVGRRRSRWPRM